MTTQHFPIIKRRTAGFTIVELLLVIAILFVLVGLVMVALRTGRRSASRTESLNALRQMTNAYNVYATDHKGRLMPGYIDPADLMGATPLDIDARLRTGFDLGANNTLAASDVSSYVWRLAPYLDHDWSVLMTDYRDEQLVTALETEYGNGSTGGAFGPATVGPNQYGIARVPSYGLNSIFLGGDSFHGPGDDNAPWRDGKRPFVATRLSEVLSPAKIIVFGACKVDDATANSLPDSASVLGYCELRAPQVYDDADPAALVLQWTVDAEGQAVLELGTDPAGLPISRLDDERVPISHLDGSTEAEYIHRLAEDMSRWAPNALSSN